MILGAFGDSFLFGSDLSDIQDEGSEHFFCHSKLTYPSLIAKKLNLEYYCTALPGQGNKVISDDVIRAVSYNKNTMFYMINWSWIDRYEYLDQARVGNAQGWNSTLPGMNTAQSNSYYKYFYSDIDAKLSNLMYINTALDVLLDNQCKFVMTYMDHLLFDSQWDCTISIEYLQNRIQNYTSDFAGSTFLEWSRKNNFPESDHWHPLEQAHSKAAEYWLPKVRTLLNTIAKED